jgi:zinc/manganese transport system substrate-binding protein
MQHLQRRGALRSLGLGLASAAAWPIWAHAGLLASGATSGATLGTTIADGKAAPPLRVVASFSILADWLRNVGGDAISVHALVGPNADAHVFEPSPQDARRLKEADLVVVNGLGFEGWIDRLIKASGYRGTVITASSGIEPRRQRGVPDPHVWQSLTHAAHCVANLRDALNRALPTEAALLTERSTRYVAQINALHRQLQSRFAALPKPQRRVITSHDAFGYLGAAYDIEFLAPQGMSTGSEASAAAVARLIDQVKRQSVRALFVENVSDPRLMQRLAHEGGAVLGGRLYSDALSMPGTEADTYLKLFAHNAGALISGMQGRKATPS